MAKLSTWSILSLALSAGVIVPVVAQRAPVQISPPAPVATRQPATFHKQVDMDDLGDAEETLSFTKSGLWHIRVDLTLNGGCYAAAFFENGTVIRVGYDPIGEQPTFGIGNNWWRSLHDGETQRLEIQPGSFASWDGDGVVLRKGPTPFVYISTPNIDFFRELSASHSVKVTSDGRDLGTYLYDGFENAMVDLMSCQTIVDEALDPFSSEPVGNDPFAQDAPSG